MSGVVCVACPFSYSGFHLRPGPLTSVLILPYIAESLGSGRMGVIGALVTVYFFPLMI